jgi:hypothetical protein
VEQADGGEAVELPRLEQQHAAMLARANPFRAEPPAHHRPLSRTVRAVEHGNDPHPEVRQQVDAGIDDVAYRRDEAAVMKAFGHELRAGVRRRGACIRGARHSRQ